MATAERVARSRDHLTAWFARRRPGGAVVSDRRAATAAGHGVARGLRLASWLVALFGGGLAFALPGSAKDAPTRFALVVMMVVLFAIVVARLVLAAVRRPAKRLSLMLLAAGVGLWAAGSATVCAGQTVAVVTFPAPGEALYLASYLGMAAFLLLDVPRPANATAAVWIEAVVVCGTAVCLAGFAVLTPLSGVFDRGGLQLLLAVLYLLFDLFLARIVLAQVMLRQRHRSFSAALLTLGFLGLAMADSYFMLGVTRDVYSSSFMLDALWGLSFAAIVDGACARPRRRWRCGCATRWASSAGASRRPPWSPWSAPRSA